MITPYLPYVGLATGGLTVGRYAAESYLSKEEDQGTHSPQAQDSDPSPSEDDQTE